MVSRYAELYLGDKINPNLTKIGGLVCSYSLNIKIELIVVNLHLKDAFQKRAVDQESNAEIFIPD